jgi:predicted SAM-dependent methyltransferase
VSQVPPPLYFDARAELAYRFLAGEGLEIGALHRPLAVPSQARVRYVDRMPVEDLRAAYEEVGQDIVPVDVVDDGETLATVEDGSQSFIVANHFLEHTEDPIGTIANHLARLKPGGVLFYAVPDQRYTFDFRREVTTLDHMVRDHEEGPQVSRREHYDEWSLLVDGTEEERAQPNWPQQAEKSARRLEDQDYSIHFHVWTKAAFLGLLLHCQERFEETFEVEVAAGNGEETIVVLRKAGASPEPATDTPNAATLSAEVASLKGDVARLEVSARELERVKLSSSWRVTEPLRAAKARLAHRR